MFWNEADFPSNLGSARGIRNTTRRLIHASCAHIPFPHQSGPSFQVSDVQQDPQRKVTPSDPSSVHVRTANKDVCVLNLNKLHASLQEN